MKLKLTPRDIKLLQTIDEFGFLTTKQINQLVFKGVNYRTVLRRLRKLKKVKLVQQTRLSPSEMGLWHLSKKGAFKIGVEYKIKSINKNLIEHDILVTDTRLSLQQLRIFTHWRSGHHLRYFLGKELLHREEKNEAVPDWICSVLTHKGPKTLALEVELTYKGMSRMQGVFRKYLRKKAVDHLWYLVPNKLFGQRLVRVLSQFYGLDEKSPHWFLWSAIDEVINDPWKVKLHSLHESFSACDLFQLPAHPNAHAVGS